MRSRPEALSVVPLDDGSWLAITAVSPPDRDGAVATGAHLDALDAALPWTTGVPSGGELVLRDGARQAVGGDGPWRVEARGGWLWLVASEAAATVHIERWAGARLELHLGHPPAGPSLRKIA